MNKKTAIDYFGSAAKLAKALGVSRSAVSQWDECIPPLRAFQIEHITNGRLMADRPSMRASDNH
ncbi:Cro/CI family transcriptional regulator [Oceanospirillum sediminis]|uniref:Cro/Cl family transcriptional regulator n=1 Tax=Oceanospirillum sediminis TaxID=2760088 RepID=A0A839IXH1_9GAMM|nr:Cro/CI family transcriptional regulator [Oceanospirillum sediminis]MBB1489077.1 Cro/Cl family transcriptional regulator [Oceanospirillum sediminis]